MGKGTDLPGLKPNTSDELFRSNLTSRACEARARLIHRLANRDEGLLGYNFICRSCIRPQKAGPTPRVRVNFGMLFVGNERAKMAAPGGGWELKFKERKSTSFSSKVLIARSQEAAIACWLECRTRDRKVASSNPGRSGERIFFSRVNFVC